MPRDGLLSHPEAIEPGILRWRLDTGLGANAFGPEAVAALLDDLAGLGDLEGGVLVLSGRPRVFSAGAALPLVEKIPDAAWAEFILDVERACILLSTLPLVTIAVIEGPCIGLGAELALACDYRVAGPGAALSWPEVRFGIPGPVRQLGQHLGRAQALDLLLTGRSVGAEEALALGLLTAVVESADLAGEVARLVDTVRDLPGAAVRATKQALAEHAGPPIDPTGAFLATAVAARQDAEFQAQAARLRRS